LTAPFVLDASVVLAILLPDEHSPRADALIAGLVPGQAWGPQHWPLEVADGLLTAVRRRRIDDRFRRGALEDAALIPVQIAGDTSALAWSTLSDLAVRHALTVYDAAYLELARRRRMPLATLDGQLAKAARADGIDLVLA
jgi:predicted nucleic acid-binding protein